MRVLLLNFGYAVVSRKLARGQNLKVQLACFIYELDLTFPGWLWFSLLYDFGSFFITCEIQRSESVGALRKNKIKSYLTHKFLFFLAKQA